MTERGFRSEQGWLDRVIATDTRRIAARTSSLRQMSPTFITLIAQRAFTVRLPVSTVTGKTHSAVRVGGSKADISRRGRSSDVSLRDSKYSTDPSTGVKKLARLSAWHVFASRRLLCVR
jgi:hypothetical protein